MPQTGAIRAGCASFIGGTKTVPSSARRRRWWLRQKPRQFVWVGARVDNNGNPQNTAPCFIGNSANQNIPIPPSNYGGVVTRIDDAVKVFVRVVWRVQR